MANITTNSEKSPQPNTSKKLDTQETSLMGTFVSVMLIGGFLLLSWLLVFFLFILRN